MNLLFDSDVVLISKPDAEIEKGEVFEISNGARTGCGTVLDPGKPANLALDTEVAWLQTSSTFFVDEDEKQTESGSALFKQTNAEIPERVDPKLIEEIS